MRLAHLGRHDQRYVGLPRHERGLAGTFGGGHPAAGGGTGNHGGAISAIFVVGTPGLGGVLRHAQLPVDNSRYRPVACWDVCRYRYIATP